MTILLESLDSTAGKSWQHCWKVLTALLESLDNTDGRTLAALLEGLDSTVGKSWQHCWKDFGSTAGRSWQHCWKVLTALLEGLWQHCWKVLTALLELCADYLIGSAGRWWVVVNFDKMNSLIICKCSSLIKCLKIILIREKQ